jgi:hypothetical protein
MSSLADRLRQQKTLLSHTKTLVRRVDGSAEVEEDGVSCGRKATETEAGGRFAGFVVDTEPDLKVAEIIASNKGCGKRIFFARFVMSWCVKGQL